MASAKTLTAGSIWKALSKINVNEYTEEKAGLTYLSWGHAWRIMQEHYPDLVVKWNGTTDQSGVIRDLTYYEGGTAMVSCTVTIGDVVREMWLPVMDYRNKSIAHPSSRDISDAKMRCLVKCFSLFGLANYLYVKDGLPAGEDSKPATPKKAPAKQKKASTVDHIAKLRTVATDLHERGWTPEGETKKEIKSVIASGDQEKAAVLTKKLEEAGELALKLNDEKEEN